MGDKPLVNSRHLQERLERACTLLDDLAQEIGHARGFIDGIVVRGRCRICGCSDDHGCDEGCAWADKKHTLCTHPDCLAAAALVKKAQGRARRA